MSAEIITMRALETYLRRAKAMERKQQAKRCAALIMGGAIMFSAGMLFERLAG
jgi:hypothetical protein